MVRTWQPFALLEDAHAENVSHSRSRRKGLTGSIFLITVNHTTLVILMERAEQL